MHFSLVDRVVESDERRLVAVKLVTAGEEYLRDHFPTFPVLPGVLMLEAMVEAARLLLERRGEGDGAAWVLGGVRAVKYGSFVRPGQLLRVEVSLVAQGKAEGTDGGARAGAPDACPREVEFKARGEVVDAGASLEGEHDVAVSGRFSLRAARPGSEEV